MNKTWNNLQESPKKIDIFPKKRFHKWWMFGKITTHLKQKPWLSIDISTGFLPSPETTQGAAPQLCLLVDKP
jgi:hypothetical protein